MMMTYLLIGTAVLQLALADDSDCVPKDSDSCLQASDSRFATETCESAARYCSSYRKDLNRCCPETCGTGALSKWQCEANGGAGTCTYPNEAQCGDGISG